MEPSGIGKTIMIIGGLIFVIGLAIAFSDRLPFLKALGRLPGDFSWKGENWQVHFPLATSILLSVLLTVLFWVMSWLSNRGR